MTTKRLPGGQPLPIEEERLKPLLRDAILGARSALSSVPVKEQRQSVYRPTETGVASAELPVPMYRKSEIWEAGDRIQRLPEARALLDYLWSKNALAMELIADGDAEPTFDGWVSFVWVDLIREPLLYLCALAATRDLSDRGEHVPWSVDERDLDRAVDDLVALFCRRIRTFEALCPVINAVVEGDSFDVGRGITISSWTAAEHALFLTRYESEYLDDDSSLWGRGALVKVRMSVSAERDDYGLSTSYASTVKRDAIASKAIADLLDRLKWATIIACGGIVLEEGPVVVRTPSGGRIRTLRRGDTVFRTRSYQCPIFNDATVSQMRRELDGLQSLSDQASTVEEIVWALGRSCAAQLARDALLEAAIGLERLLLPREAGESTYKFRLHGLGVLKEADATALDRDLRDIYRLRSRAAHGSGQADDVFDVLGPRARTLLAMALQQAVALFGSGELKVAATGGHIGDAVAGTCQRQ